MRACLVILLAVPLLGVGGASAQPHPICDVCGATFHEGVTSTTATLQMTAGGNVHWRVENTVDDSTARKWRENPDRLTATVDDRLEHTWGVPTSVHDRSVEMAGNTVIITFVDRGVVRNYLGVSILPYLHGESVERRLVINADRFTVVAPEGQEILNAPSGAEVRGDRAIWRGEVGETEARDRWAAPEPGDTYVVTGGGATADLRQRLVMPFVPLDPGLYGLYLIGLFLVAGLPFGLYTIHGHRLGPPRVLAGIGVSALPYLYLIGSVHPPQLGGFGIFLVLYGGLLSLLLGLCGGGLLMVWADAKRRES